MTNKVFRFALGLIQIGLALLWVLLGRDSFAAPGIYSPLAVIHLLAGIMILSARRPFVRAGIVLSVGGFLLPFLIFAMATPVDKDYSSLLGLGFDAEGLGLVMLLRVMFELPLWAVYGALTVTSVP